MGERALVFSPAPYHILSYGTLLGSQFFHTFVNATVSFKILDRPQFAMLQRNLFPAYFGMQTVLPVALALTYPGSRIVASGLRGVLDEYNRWSVLVPLTTAFVTGLVNWAYLLPKVNQLTDKRRQQEKKDGKRSWDAPPHSQEMDALNKKFGQLHGISSFVNLVTFVATLAYGFHLASRID